MKDLRRYFCFAAALIPLPSLAQESNLWSYSCDHFLHGSCLRIPHGMSVTYEAPADFGLHRVHSDGREVVMVYEGDAPSRPPAGVPDVTLGMSGHLLHALKVREAGGVRYDLHVSSSVSDAMSLHLTGQTTNAAEQAALAAVLGGFRICSFKRNRTAQRLVCPRRSAWGQALSTWVADEVVEKPLAE